MHRTVLLALMLGTLPATAVAQTREEKVLADRRKVEAEGFWIYGDLARGFAEAKKTGKPLLVVLRCIPCEECVKLDDDLINRDERVEPLLEKFVRVRVVSANGLDLSLFQFDYDQSFAVFLLNADGTIYGRFGTRSHRTAWSDDVSVEGLAQALEGALALHREYPKGKHALAGKKGPAPEVASPEKFPMLRDKYEAKLDYTARVVQGCIHCHQVGDAQRQFYLSGQVQLPEQGLPERGLPEQVLFSYPHPKTLGLILDPRRKAAVLRVEENSLAQQAGFQAGDGILRLAGQPLLSIADVQWVLHQTPAEGAALRAQVERNGRQVELTLTLPKGWRQREDLSWRASTWNLRRMTTGGLLLETLPAAEREKAELAEGAMALRVKHVGQYGPHAAAKNAGFQAGDILISFDAQTDLARETDLIAYALRTCKPGEQVPVTVLREGKQVELTLPMQE